VRADHDFTVSAGAAFAEGEHGDFRGFEAAWAELGHAKDPLSRAWRLALESIRWVFEPSFCGSPDAAEVRKIARDSPGTRPVLARICSVMERAYIAALDRERLAIWVEVHEAIHAANPLGGSAEVGDVSLRASQLWLRLLGGDGGGSDGVAKQLFEDASRLRAPTQVIESTVLRALLALSAGDTEPAVELARRASRMAQAESLPQLEYLANLTLARVRRYSGRPHLALHILVALSRVAPPLWWGWIAWEIILAGGEPAGLKGVDASVEGHAGAGRAASAERRSLETPSTLAARDLARFLQSVRDGDRSAFTAMAEELRKRTECWWDLGQEAETLLAAVDGFRDTAPARLEPWRRGDTTNIPCGLHAIGIPRGADLETETATAFVLAGTRSKGRRVLRPGLALSPQARVLTRESAKNAAAGVRTETGIAALALAGPAGMSREDFFRIVYGFPFVPHRHQAVLDVLCHRMRNLLGDAGELRRDGGEAAAASVGVAGGPSLALVLNEIIAVPDMRCALPTSDRVLRALATLGTTSASDAAESLLMPLRTVQAVLQQLVAEGACTVEREGRRVSYRIEDTTFTEVTSVSAQPRLAGPELLR
jgi:hypothetical protein